MRTTLNDIYEMIEYLNKLMNTTKPGTRYILGAAYGGYRLEKETPGGGCKDISPRGTKTEVYNWMNAYIKGIEAVKYKK